MEAEKNELVVVDEKKVLAAFSEKGGVDFLMDEVKKIVEDFEPDLSTAKSRKEIASLAAKVATWKSYLDKTGKELTAVWKAKSKLVDENRKHLRDELAKLKILARKPLTDWEEAEENRIKGHMDGVTAIRALKTVEVETSEAYATNLKAAKEVTLGERWDEFAAAAAEAKDEVVTFLEASYIKTKTAEEEKVELDRLRKADEARKEKEREEKIRLEGVRLAKGEAAAKIKRAKEATATAKREKKEAEDKAKADKIEADRQAKLAAEKATSDQAAAVEKAKKDEAARIAAEAKQKEEAAAKKAANVKHRSKIHKEAKESLMGIGADEETAVKIIKAIAADEITNVFIQY